MAKTPKTPTTAQAQAAAYDQMRKRALRGAQHHNWARRCHSLARMATTRSPADEADAPILGMFVVTLVGMLDETARFFERAAGASDPDHQRQGAAGVDVVRRLRAAFTDDDLIYLQYRRHVECHPTQDGYEQGFSGDQPLTVKSRFAAEKTRAEVDAQLTRVMRRIGPLNEYDYVRKLAARALPFLGYVELAAMGLHLALEPIRARARYAATMAPDWWNGP